MLRKKIFTTKLNRLKLKTFSRVAVCVAGTFSVLCNTANGEFIEGESPDYFYIRAFAPLTYRDSISEEAAFARAELEAYEEFVRHAISARMCLPESLESLRPQIENGFITTSWDSNISGARVLKSSVLKDKRVSCTVQIPKKALRNFPSMDFRDCPLKLLGFCGEDPFLHYEILARLGKADSRCLFGEASRSVDMWRSGKFIAIPATWRFDGFDLRKEAVAEFSSKTLVELWISAAGGEPFAEIISKVLAERGLTLTAEQFKALPVPQKESFPRGVAALKAAEMPGTPIAINLLKHDCAVVFFKEGCANPEFEAAQKEFSKKQPDYKRMAEHLEASLTLSVSAEALNLLGRAYEELGEYFSAAVVLAQAVSMDLKSAYVRANYAEMLFRIGAVEDAEYWANHVLEDPRANTWALKRCRSLMDKIHPPPSQTES